MDSIPFGTIVEILVGIVVSAFGWSLNRNIHALDKRMEGTDAKLTSIEGKVDDLRKDDSRIREELASMRERLSHVERLCDRFMLARHSTGEHESIR